MEYGCICFVQVPPGNSVDISSSDIWDHLLGSSDMKERSSFLANAYARTLFQHTLKSQEWWHQVWRVEGVSTLHACTILWVKFYLHVFGYWINYNWVFRWEALEFQELAALVWTLKNSLSKKCVSQHKSFLVAPHWSKGLIICIYFKDTVRHSSMKQSQYDVNINYFCQALF